MLPLSTPPCLNLYLHHCNELWLYWFRSFYLRRVNWNIVKRRVWDSRSKINQDTNVQIILYLFINNFWSDKLFFLPTYIIQLNYRFILMAYTVVFYVLARIKSRFIEFLNTLYTNLILCVPRTMTFSLAVNSNDNIFKVGKAETI